MKQKNLKPKIKKILNKKLENESNKVKITLKKYIKTKGHK